MHLICHEKQHREIYLKS
uniref:Uncharacterized protein n=1 Tax=Arundo donax TaxID=35708 RepID=A0A0A9H793_ARUDO